MLMTPIPYLFFFAFLATGVSYLLQKRSLGKKGYFVGIFMIFSISFALHFFGLLHYNEVIAVSVENIQKNMLLAMLFLFALGVRRDFSGALGCACNLGVKNYWSVLVLSFVVAVVVHFVAFSFSFEGVSEIIAASLMAFVFGVVGSYTRLSHLQGSQEVATTMSYLFVALLAPQLYYLSVA